MTLGLCPSTGKMVYDFFIGDDISTLNDPNAGAGYKLLAVASITSNFTPGGGVVKGLKLVGKGLKVAKGMGKAVNLPSWKKVTIDMEHVISGHTKGGSRIGPGSTKDLFPESMTTKQIEKEIREAYKYGERIKTQGDTVKIRGNGGTLDIELWVNTVTKEIETAYPIF